MRFLDKLNYFYLIVVNLGFIHLFSHFSECNKSDKSDKSDKSYKSDWCASSHKIPN